MNKRIKLLIERAEYQAKKQSGYEDWEVYVPPDPQVVFEKFAELIIAESCVALHPMLRDMISRTQGVDMIVNHFKGEE